MYLTNRRGRWWLTTAPKLRHKLSLDVREFESPQVGIAIATASAIACILVGVEIVASGSLVLGVLCGILVSVVPVGFGLFVGYSLADKYHASLIKRNVLINIDRSAQFEHMHRALSPLLKGRDLCDFLAARPSYADPINELFRDEQFAAAYRDLENPAVADDPATHRRVMQGIEARLAEFVDLLTPMEQAILAAEQAAERRAAEAAQQARETQRAAARDRADELIRHGEAHAGTFPTDSEDAA